MSSCLDSSSSISCKFSFSYRPLSDLRFRRKRTTGAIEQPVSDLDRIVNRISTSGVVDFPQPKPNEGHLVTRVQLDSRHGVFMVDLTGPGMIEQKLFPSSFTTGRGATLIRPRATVLFSLGTHVDLASVYHLTIYPKGPRDSCRTMWTLTPNERQGDPGHHDRQRPFTTVGTTLVNFDYVALVCFSREVCTYGTAPLGLSRWCGYTVLEAGDFMHLLLVWYFP